MNKMLLGLIVAASVVANAQTSSTTAAPAAQTSTVSTVSAAPKAASTWSAGAYLGMAAMGNEIKNGDAVSSTNFLELGYQLAPNYKLAVRHNFSYSFNGSNEFNDNYDLIDPELQLKTKLSPIGKSTPVAVAFRYYVPATEASVQSERYGTLRIDTSAEWSLTPKFALGAYVGPRITFNNAGGSTGTGAEERPTNSDDVVRLIVSPSATYSFTDKINMYYAPALDYATNQVAYSKIDAKSGYAVDGMKHNVLAHEVGANFQVGKVGINPAVINYTDLSTGDTGYGKAERMEYDVNVSATF